MAKWRIILAGLVAGAVAIGGGAAYLFFKGIPAVEGTNPIASAKIVPDEALFAGYLSGDVNAWAKLEKFGTPATKQLVSGSIKQLLSGFDTQVLEGQDVTFEEDILPWLGSIMFAAVPDSENVPQPLMVVGIRDKAAALGFANKMKDGEGTKVKETEYQGVKVLEITQGSNNSMFLAILDHHLALSNQRPTIEAAIDTSKGEPSLATVSEAEQVFAPSLELDNPVANIFVPNYNDFAKTIADSGFNGQGAFSPEFFDRLQQFESAALGIGIDGNGLRLRSRFTTSDTTTWSYTPIPDTVVAKFPADTMALISGGGINQQWTKMVDQLADNSEAKRNIELVRQRLLQATQLDLDKDILGWMDGEFALALIPSRQGLLSQTGFGGALLLKTSDRNTATATFSKLDQLASSSPLQVNQRNVGGTSVTEWQVPIQGGLFAHGWLDSQTTFMVIGGPLADVVASPPQQSLQDSAIFKAATAGLSNNNAGYFYINMEQATDVMTSTVFAQQFQFLTPEVLEIMKSMQGIGAATTQVNDTTFQSDVIVTLKENE